MKNKKSGVKGTSVFLNFSLQILKKISNHYNRSLFQTGMSVVMLYTRVLYLVLHRSECG